MPRRYYTYGEGSGWDFWNVVVSLGALFLAASMLLFVFNLGYSLKHGEVAGNNPWDAADARVGDPSPPPAYNFAHRAGRRPPRSALVGQVRPATTSAGHGHGRRATRICRSVQRR